MSRTAPPSDQQRGHPTRRTEKPLPRLPWASFFLSMALGLLLTFHQPLPLAGAEQLVCAWEMPWVSRHAATVTGLRLPWASLPSDAAWRPIRTQWLLTTRVQSPLLGVRSWDAGTQPPRRAHHACTDHHRTPRLSRPGPPVGPETSRAISAPRPAGPPGLTPHPHPTFLHLCPTPNKKATAPKEQGGQSV